MVKRPLGMVVERLHPAVVKITAVAHAFIGQAVDVGHAATLALKVKIWDAVRKSGFVEQFEGETEGALVVLVWGTVADNKSRVVRADAEILSECCEGLPCVFCETERRRDDYLVSVLAALRQCWGGHYPHLDVPAGNCKRIYPQCGFS